MRMSPLETDVGIIPLLTVAIAIYYWTQIDVLHKNIKLKKVIEKPFYH
jgi:hypothetical protein